MKKDLIITGLIFALLISIGMQIKSNYKNTKLEKELQDTINVVYYAKDKLDLAYEMIDLLNKEQIVMQKQIDEMKEFKRLTKELR